MHSDFPHYLIHIHSPSPRTPCPPLQTLAVTLTLTTNITPGEKENKNHRDTTGALWNICKQPAQESQPIPAASIRTAGAAAPLSIPDHGKTPVPCPSGRPSPEPAQFPGWQEMRGCSGQGGLEEGEAPGEAKLGSCGMYARDKRIPSSFPAF